MNSIPVNQDQKLLALQSNSYFKHLTDSILIELSESTWLRSYHKDELIFWEKDPCAGLHIIQSGSVKLFKTSPQGRELIIKVFEEGATFNEVPVFDHGKNPVNAAAMQDCQIWVVDSAAIHTAMKKHPQMCQAVVLNLAENLRMLVSLVDELSFYQVTHRLARLLTTLPLNNDTGKITQRITQDQLAARLGTVREVVARSLKVLERAGAILVNRGQITIRNGKILEEWTQTPEN